MKSKAVPALSVLDLSPVRKGFTAADALQDTLKLAKFVDQLGYKRYWLAEHHDMGGIACTSPEIIIPHVANVTSNIRVGSGGIMLPNHSALKVAENFRTLEAFHPGRIDLGLGRAPGTNGRTAIALRGKGERLSADNFPEQVADLTSFLTDNFADDHPYKNIHALPGGVGLPELWILGSSDWGATFAGQAGFPYSFAQHFSPAAARDILKVYRQHFEPSPLLEKPRAMVCVRAICADTDTEAQDLAMSGEYTFFRLRQTGKSEPLPSVEEIKSMGLIKDDWLQIKSYSMANFVGSQETLRSQITKFAEDCQLDELMVLTMVYDQKARQHSYKLLADLFI
ncbi:MAG: LLM class flavin-dependent oxidoreductase [Bdellovibrionota bacterium]